MGSSQLQALLYGESRHEVASRSARLRCPRNRNNYSSSLRLALYLRTTHSAPRPTEDSRLNTAPEFFPPLIDESDFLGQLQESKSPLPLFRDAIKRGNERLKTLFNQGETMTQLVGNAPD